ncbi:sulfatase-like hydrolase/transferase [Polaribacter sp. PL03]|uniref:sulfatase-like hydrolase/transferase n=1 Tax=Polaribacter sp. PL03 TaxID=3088353 RepID=UPI0029D1CC64|nr:sulfatase-like hydrolase/transferase [Polaribacter sp. PL03]MDX6746946.1 sulfatase-like hydrolase/transferase [Polaribacter sp. PL03]
MKHIKYILLNFCIIFTVLSCKKTSEKVALNEIKKERPNIIWIMAEDMSTDLETYGMPNVKTPNLNKMASEGIRFDNAFVTNSICSPSRSAMMIGTHQIKTNTHHHRSNRKTPLDTQFKPFTKLLRDAGYTTILGNQSVMKKGRKIDVNFKHKPIGNWDGKTAFGLFDKYDTFTKEDQPFFAQIQLVVTHRGDWWNEVREKSKHPVDPKTLSLPPYMADHPAIRLDWAKYLDQIEYMDHEVGMIFKELEDKGMADNTIVIFIGDNGRCNIKGKGYLQDPGLRIPFIVYYPEQFKGGQVRKDVVSATDITASIVDFAGIKVPNYMTGKPIFNKNFDRKFVYGARDLWDEIEEKSRAVTSGEWSYIRNDMPNTPFDAQQAYLEFYRPAVHVMRKMYKEGTLNEDQIPFFEPTKPKEELYNLKKDPHQLKNLANNIDYKDILEKLRAKMLEFDKEIVPVSTIYNPISVPGQPFIKWFQKEKPAAYQQMKEGVEVGYKKYSKEYKKTLKSK